MWDLPTQPYTETDARVFQNVYARVVIATLSSYDRATMLTHMEERISRGQSAADAVSPASAMPVLQFISLFDQ